MRDVKHVRDIPPEAAEKDLVYRVFGNVWIAVEEKHEDGSAAVQYLPGEPAHNVEGFLDLLGVAGSLLGLDGDEEIAAIQTVSN